MDSAREGDGDGSVASLMASLLVGTAFFSLWFWLLPGWLGFRVEIAGADRWRWLAAIPSVLGFAVALRCVWDFGWTGHGTPAPVAPAPAEQTPAPEKTHKTCKKRTQKKKTQKTCKKPVPVKKKRCVAAKKAA